MASVQRNDICQVRSKLKLRKSTSASVGYSIQHDNQGMDTTIPTSSHIDDVEASSSHRVCPVCLQMPDINQAEDIELAFSHHVNQCLDSHHRSPPSPAATNMAKEDYNDTDSIVAAQIQHDEKENEEKSMKVISQFCPVCGRLLSHLSFESKQLHVDQCCHNNQQTPSSTTANQSTICPVCNKNLSKIKNHLMHIKRCGQTHGMTTEQLIQCCQQKGLTGTNLNETKAKPTKRKVLSKVDEETQLALALSASIHDEGKRQQKNVFALPGDLTSVGNKKRRKKGFKNMPAILMQSEEELKENIARNACQLLQENDDNDIQPTQSMSSSKLTNLYAAPQSDKSPCNELKSTLELSPLAKAASIWSLSANLTPSKKVDHFYVDKLLPDQQSSHQADKAEFKSPIQKERQSSNEHIKEKNAESTSILGDIHQQLFQDLSLMLKSDNFCDVTIIAKDGEQIMAHACILAARSPYFYNEFHAYGNDCKYEVILKEFPATVINAILAYIYAGNVELPPDILIDIARLAKKLKLRHLYRYAKSLLKSSDVSDTTKMIVNNHNTTDESKLLAMKDEDISLDMIDLTQLTPCKETTTSTTLPPTSPVSSDDVVIQPSQQLRPNSVVSSPLKKDDEVVITSKPDMDNSLQLSDEILFLSQNNAKDSTEKSVHMTDNKYPDHSDIDEDFQFFDDGGYNADLDFFLMHHNSTGDIQDNKDVDSIHTSQENSNINRSPKSFAKENPRTADCKAPSQPSIADYSTPELKNQLEKYGVRALPKREMIAKLQQINQFLNDNENQLNGSDPSELSDLSDDSNSLGSYDISILPDDDENSETDDIMSTQEVREGNIKDKVAAFIKANRTVYMSVLKFEPLDLRDLHRQLKASSIKCPRKKLPAILDELGISFSMQRNVTTGKTKDKDQSSKESDELTST